MEKDIFKFQQDAIDSLVILDNRNRTYSTLVAVPTGGGKTRIAIKYLHDYVFPKDKQKVLWLGERLTLLKQTEERFKEFDNNGKVVKVNISYFSSEGDSIDDEENWKDKNMIIVTQQTLTHKDNLEKNEHFKKWLEDTEILTIIIDEAHHATSTPYLKILKYISKFQDLELHVIGLTATPYSDDIDKIFLHGVIEENGTKELSTNACFAYKIDSTTLIANGVLSKPSIAIAKTKETGKIVPADIVSAYKNGVSGIKKFGKTIIFVESRRDALELEYLFKNMQGGEVKCGLAITIQKDLFEWKDEEVDTEDVYKYIESLKTSFKNKRDALSLAKGWENDEHAKHLKHDVISNVVSQKTRQVKEDIESYKKENGGVDVLISVKMLEEGIDLPKTETVFLANNDASVLEVVQMVGRGLRGVAQGGTPTANIIAFSKDICEKICLVMPELQSNEDGELKISKFTWDSEKSEKLDPDYTYESIKFLMYDVLDKEIALKKLKKYFGIKSKGKKYFPKAYHMFYKKCLLEWIDDDKIFVDYICENIEKIYKSFGKTDEELEKVLTEGRQNDFLTYCEEVVKTDSYLSIYARDNWERGLYYLSTLLWLYNKDDKNLVAFKEDSKRYEFPDFDERKVIEKCLDLPDESVKEELQKQWKEMEEKDVIWSDEEEFTNYIIDILQDRKKCIQSIPRLDEEELESEDDYFGLKLYREGRKRRNLVCLIKKIIIESGLKDKNFFDVFGGSGTVSANISDLKKLSPRLKNITINEFDCSVANFLRYCNGSLENGTISEILKEYNVADLNIATIVAKAEDSMKKDIEKLKYDYLKKPYPARKDDVLTNEDIDNLVHAYLQMPDMYLKSESDNYEVAKDKKLEEVYDKKYEKLVDAMERHDIHSARYMQLKREVKILDHPVVKNYVKMYLALYYMFSKELAEKAFDDELRRSINDENAGEDGEKIREYKELVFKFLFVYGFPSRKFASSGITGVDIAGIKSFRKRMCEKDSWLIEFCKRMKGTKVVSKDFADILYLKNTSTGEDVNDPDTIFYLDPPYFLTAQYECAFSDGQHLSMLRWLRQTESKWIFSCKSRITNKKEGERNIPKEGQYIRYQDASGNPSLEEYFKLFIYNEIPSSREVVADMKSPTNKELYVYYAEPLEDNAYEIMISNIAPQLEDNNNCHFESYGFKCMEFKDFFTNEEQYKM